MLTVTNLTKRYKNKTVVQDVSFTLRPGEVMGYLGPNGAGKSTTVKMLTGLLPPTSGQICYQGRPIQSNLADYKINLGYVPEEPHLYSYLSGWEYLQLVGRLRGLPEELLKWRMDELLTFFKIVTGLVTLLNWDFLFPDSRDYAALAPLPVKPRTFFLAKVAAFLGASLPLSSL